MGSLAKTTCLIDIATRLEFSYDCRPFDSDGMRALILFLMVVLVCVTSTGCPSWRWRYPWHPVGTIYEQGNRATIHDPFPDNDLGANVEGIRPREFSAPLDLPVRDRLYSDSRLNR